jgi:hypothetical protein
LAAPPHGAEEVSPSFLPPLVWPSPQLRNSRLRLDLFQQFGGLLGFAPGLVELHDAFGAFREAAPGLDADRRDWRAGPVRRGKFSKLFTRPWKLGLGGGRFLR